MSIRIADNPSVPDTFDLFVRFDGKDVEAWERLTNAAAPVAPGRGALATINDSAAGSRYIQVAAASANNPDTTDVDDTATFVPLEDGADDELDAAGLEAAITEEWSRFDAYDVQLLSCPEVNTKTVVDDALTYCANRGECVYLGFTSQNDNLESAITYGAQFRANKVYGAIYFPWIQVAKETGGQIWVPPWGT